MNAAADHEEVRRRTDVLVHEKGLLFSEKLAIIASIKQAYGFVGVTTGLLFGAAQAADTAVVLLVVPYVVVAFGNYLLVNSFMLTLILAHLRRVDDELHALDPGLAPTLWQRGPGGAASRWGVTIPVDGHRFVINPYVLQIVVVGVIGLSITVYSVVRAFVFLHGWGGDGVAISYVAVTIVAVGALLGTSARLGPLIQDSRVLAKLH